MQHLDSVVYDWMLKYNALKQKSGKVVIIDIDEESLARHGQWPWARYRVAELTQKILDAGAAVVAFDVVFPERDRTSPGVLEETLSRDFGAKVSVVGVPDKYRDFDELFGSVIEGRKVILGCRMTPGRLSESETAAFSEAAQDDYTGKIFVRAPETISNPERFLWPAKGVTISIPALSSRTGNASFNADPDFDNVVRSNPSVWPLGSKRQYPSLWLMALMMAQDYKMCLVEVEVNGVQHLRLGQSGSGAPNIKVPTDRSGRVLVNYRSLMSPESSHCFPSFPIWKILSGDVGEAALKDKIVFIGTSAVGLVDLKSTPVHAALPGVEVHATIVDNILAGDLLRRSPAIQVLEPLGVLLIGLFLTLVVQKGRAGFAFAASILLVSGFCVLAYVMLREAQLVVVPTKVVLATMVIYPVLTMMKFWQEEIKRRQVRNMFGTMVSPDVLRYMEQHPESFSLTGQRVDATMFFSDVAGFTSISENEDAERVSALLNEYFTPMEEEITKLGGYVDKYEGDAVMAEWGVPFPDDEHAGKACLAALAQQERLSEIREPLRQKYGHEIHVRMGLNSGQVIAGNLGSSQRFEYTVIGDAVNLAARLEPVNKDYGTQIIISEHTYMAAQEVVVARALGWIVVQGKSEAVAIYELFARKGEVTPVMAEVVNVFEEGLEFFHSREWVDALQRFRQVLELKPDDGPSLALIRRIEEYQVTPPGEGWQGEYVRTSK